MNYISIIGSGIISAILNLLIYLINLNNNIILFESNNFFSLENTKVINNAGTGHTGMCENNYIYNLKNNYYIKKNLRINYKFDFTKQLLSWIKYLKILNLNKIISNISHISYFYLKKNNIKLKKIFNKIKKIKKIKFTNNFLIIKKIFPILLKKKKIKKNFSITYYKNGFDINYELFSIKIFFFLSKKKNFFYFLNKKVILIKKKKNKFIIFLKNKKIIVNKVFICSGGDSYSLMNKFNKKIIKNYLNFPISGNWLILENNKFIKKHNIKVYSETLKKNPPMSIPHLDLRKILKKNKILFGPFAGITFNILIKKKKNIIKDLNLKKIIKIIFFSIKKIYLTKYLLKENIKSKKNKIKSIIPFFKIKNYNFYYKNAGKRLQILKIKNKTKINFGTKLIFNKNKKIFVILGASPGASIAVIICINILKKCKSNFFNFFSSNIKTNIFFNKILYI
ncbi:malate:quinone oxidoreductase [Candidatus Carsonella ruddii CS isolate Thao2000]|uniref:malate dehydrogenase (quinone) n=1 Tax=Candidatus Carsonella ruddii CS isolate Thao2000 TaxID=1202537 RepID=J7GSQ2_CARRU|nr:malate:quinone oxidoreductase [Candidatus Carsonella ruddii]AFP83782.1 malate:quinone oxidoreductase [Candidatus Carsonella ruddii CS isolate Thao2000]